MNPVDDLILEFVEEHGQYPPKEIADQIDRHEKYVGQRCRVLRDYGLLRNLARGLYQITEDGKAYLAGELDAGELEASDG